jgi:hypothetical protein
MKPIERSIILKQEADFLLEELNMVPVLSQHGKITFTGSYYLDLMIYPDIDLYVSKIPVNKVFEIAGKFASSELVSEVRFQKEFEPPLDGGLYLKLYVNYGAWERPWKIDIWFLDDSVIYNQMNDMHRFKEKLTPKLKEQILSYKYSVLTETHRTPMYSGYFIYKAFLDEGISNFGDVTNYLNRNNIKI